LRAILNSRRHLGEVKWSSVTERNLPTYKLLVDEFFSQIARHSLKYRQAFLDRQFVHISEPGAPMRSDLDVQFRLCYQFLKHHFGLKYLADTNPECNHLIIIRLDAHSSQRHTEQLAEFIGRLSHVLGSPRIIANVHYVDSKRLVRLQLCDLIMGAAGSHGNKMHLRREAGQRGMTSKQKSRFELAMYVYNSVRQLDASERGSKAFNWFESTGTDGDPRNRFHHKLRIWKIIPRKYQIDEGWQNSNLDSQGRYLGLRLNPRIMGRETKS